MNDDFEKDIQEIKIMAPVLAQPLVDVLKTNSKELVEAIKDNTEANNRVAKALEDFIAHQWHSVR